MARRLRARRKRGVRRRAPVRRRARVSGRRRLTGDGIASTSRGTNAVGQAIGAFTRASKYARHADELIRLGKRARYGATGANRMHRKMGPFGSGRRKRVYNIGAGKLVGRFPRPNKMKALDKYAMYGFRQSQEVYGTVTHKDVAYLGVMSAHINSVGEAVGAALIRRIMKTHYQVEYSDINQAIAAAQPGPTSPLDIYFWYEQVDAAGVVSRQQGPRFIVGTQTCKQFASWFSLNVWAAELFNHHSTAHGQYTHLYGYELTHIDGVDTRPTQIFQLDNVKLHVYQSCKMLIQNTTPSDNGSRDGDSIDANPIQGRLFKFKGLVPDIRDNNDTFGFNALENDRNSIAAGNGDGILIPNVNPTNSWRGVPGMDVFKNCMGYSKVSLQPGEIKHFKIKFNFVGSIVDLMKGMYFGNNRVVNGATNTLNRMGTCIMFALEKTVRTGTADDVVVNWHIDREVGAYWGTKKRVVMRKDFALSTYNVDPTNDE